MFRFLGKRLLLFSTNPPNAVAPKTTHFLSFVGDLMTKTLATCASSPIHLQKSPSISSGLSSKSTISAPRKKVAAQSAESSKLGRIFTNYGLSSTDASAIISKHSSMLLAIPVRTIKTKLGFFQGDGFTGHEIADILMTNPGILKRPFRRGILSSLDFLKSILPSRQDVVKRLICTDQSLKPRHRRNIETLLHHGVPSSNILKVILFHSRPLSRGTERFNAAVEKAKVMGLDPTSYAFVVAVDLLSYMTRSTLLRKVNVFRKLGWSDEEIFSMFKRQPKCLGASDELIQKRMAFFEEVICWDSAFISKYPVILVMSFEKRVIPRCSVLNLLMLRGLIQKNIRSPSKFVISDKQFYDHYVQKYEKEVPEVLDAFQGKIGFNGWDWLMDEKKCDDAQKL